MPELDRCKHEMLPGQCAICNGDTRGMRASEHDMRSVKDRFRAAEVDQLLEAIRAGANRLGLVERPFVRALMLTPGEPGQGGRMVFTVAAHKEKPGQVWLYNGYTAAIHEFWPRLSPTRIRELLGPESRQGHGRYLSEHELLEFLGGLSRLFEERGASAT
jgi:hypothetical protein